MRRYDRTLHKAHLLYEAGQLAAAERIYRRLLDTLPDDTMVMHNLSVTLFAQGRRWEANTMLTKALNKNNDFPEYFATMATFLSDPVFSREIQDLWGGPFNGQPMRCRIFLDILTRIAPTCVFETGTYRGITTAFMASATEAPILSCEAHIDTFHFARRRLWRQTNVSLFHMDSRSFLQTFVPLHHVGDNVSFFYLDAHWSWDLPLLDELAIVLEQATRSVVMIDDFQVADDPGYSFDDYGPGKRLCLDYLAPLARYAPHRFFPGPSASEAGHRRGCLVLTIDAQLARKLDGVRDLRPVP